MSFFCLLDSSFGSSSRSVRWSQHNQLQPIPILLVLYKSRVSRSLNRQQRQERISAARAPDVRIKTDFPFGLIGVAVLQSDLFDKSLRIHFQTSDFFTESRGGQYQPPCQCDVFLHILLATNEARRDWQHSCQPLQQPTGR